MSLYRTKLSRSNINAARSTLYLATDIPEDPAESLTEAVRRIHEAGWTFYDRLDTFHGRKYNWTLRKRIGRSANWDSYSTLVKASICWHELVHIRQRQHRGHTWFLGKYASPWGRWEIEVPAYRQSLIAYEIMNRGAFHGTAYADRKVETMRKDYWLGRINHAQYERETKAILYLGRMATKK